MFLEYKSVCPLVGIGTLPPHGTLPPTLFLASVLPPEPKGDGYTNQWGRDTHSPVGAGVGGGGVPIRTAGEKA
jgi:hypothetical protein